MRIASADTNGDSGGRAALVLVGCLCGGLGIAGVVVTLSSPIVDHPALFATLRALLVFGLLALGLYGWAHEPEGRYPVLLLAFCCLGALTAMTSVDDPWVFALGRILTAAEVMLVAYVFLSYPDGRLDDAPALRVVVVATAGTAVLLGLALLFSTAQPVAGPFVRCAGDCPPNPLAIVDSTIGIGRLSTAALSVWTAGTAAATALLLGRRMRAATPLQRRALGPVLAWTTFVSAGYGVYVALRAADSTAAVLGAAGTVIAAIITLVPVALAAGLAQGRVFAAAALRRTVRELGERPSPARLREVLADAFRDPSLELVFWLRSVGGYVDGQGRAATLPQPGEARALTRFDVHGEPVAAALHDRVLADDAGGLEAAGGAVLLALENARLEAELRARMEELHASRARMATVAAEERRRIERDLHDGAQQHLVALRIKLTLLEELVDGDASLAAGLADAEQRTDTAIQLLRELAHGIYPQSLRDQGLTPALAFAAGRLPLPIVVHAEDVGRVAPHIETAVYFCCLEALQNVAKHAAPHTPVDVKLSVAGQSLHFGVTDRGPGFDPRAVHGGQGLTGMRDRIVALGGELEIVSVPGQGATVSGRVPLNGAS